MAIGVIGAMEEEIAHIRKEMDNVSQETKAGIVFTSGVWNGQNICLCKSGVGKVNASICTQILIDQFHASHIIFTGVAGAVDPALEIGDIVISVDALHHDMDASSLGFKKGVIPFFDHSVFKADKKLHDLALTAGKLVAGEEKVVAGRILSGDQFIASAEKVKELHEEFNGACTEMEGAAVAQVCTMNGIPFVIIRSISDKADGSANVNFQEFVEKASRNSFQIVQQMVKNWPFI